MCTALALLLAAALPAAAHARIKPKAGQYVRKGGPAILFLTVSRDRSIAKNISVSFWCGRKLTSIPVGKTRIRNVGSRSVGFDIARRVGLKNGHKVRVRMSGVWTGPRDVGGALHLTDSRCGAPPKDISASDPRTWTAFWDPIYQDG